MMANDYAMFKQAVEEERFRCERLEEQINDLTELHQHEVTNIKQVRVMEGSQLHQRVRVTELHQHEVNIKLVRVTEVMEGSKRSPNIKRVRVTEGSRLCQRGQGPQTDQGHRGVTTGSERSTSHRSGSPGLGEVRVVSQGHVQTEVTEVREHLNWIWVMATAPRGRMTPWCLGSVSRVKLDQRVGTRGSGFADHVTERRCVAGALQYGGEDGVPARGAYT